MGGCPSICYLGVEGDKLLWFLDEDDCEDLNLVFDEELSEDVDGFGGVFIVVLSDDEHVLTEFTRELCVLVGVDYSVDHVVDGKLVHYALVQIFVRVELHYQPLIG